MDNVAFFARTEEGGLIPARRETNTGKYHIDGELVLAHKEELVRSFKLCLPLFKTAKDHKILVLSPLPTCCRASCCEDPDHIPNLYEEDYEVKLLTGVDNLRRYGKDAVNYNKLSGVRVLNTLQMMSDLKGGPRTSSKLASEVISLWGDDPVHPSEVLYSKLAENVVRFAREEVNLDIPQPPPTKKRPTWIEAKQCSSVATASWPAPSRGGHGSWYRRGRRGSGSVGGRGRGRPPPLSNL